MNVPVTNKLAIHHGDAIFSSLLCSEGHKPIPLAPAGNHLFFRP